MQNAKILVAVVAVLGLGACAPASAPEPAVPTDADRQALVDFMERVEVAYNNMDAAGMLAMVADNFNEIEPDGTWLEGKMAYEASMTEGFAEERPEGFALSIEIGYVQFHGADAATIAGPYSLAGLPDGAPNTGSYLVVVTRSGDQWLMTNFLAATFVPEPAPEG